MFGVPLRPLRRASDHADRVRSSGVVAALITAFAVDLWLLGGTRILEGAAAAASIPSILGYIALATSGDQAMRGRAVARFEAATLAGIGLGIVAAGPDLRRLGRGGFLLNAGIYVVSFAIYRWGVAEIASRADRGGDRRRRPPSCGRRRWTSDAIGASSAVIRRLAPGADLDRAQRGARLVDHPIGLPARAGAPGRVPRPAADAGDSRPPASASASRRRAGLHRRALWYWGNRFCAIGRTTIIAHRPGRRAW